MIWGIKDSIKIKAKPKDNALCPICSGELIPKCGVVKEWHWSHKTLIDCDLWYEPESEWHLKWKNEFPEVNQEVTIEKDGIKHRADIKIDSGVIELQNSSISPDDICDREKFYDNMIWLLNGETLGKNFEINIKENYLTFYWKNPPTSFFYANKEIYIDLTEKLNELKEMEMDRQERVSILYDELCRLVENPHKLERYNLDKKDEHLIKTYDEWCEVSGEKRNTASKLKIFEKGTIFLIKKLYKKVPCSGWGYLISKEEFLEKVN